MKEATKQHLSQLILDELSEKIRGNESLRKKLEAFADLPVEKVADAILRQFEYLLSSELRELIIHLIEQDVAAEESLKQQESLPPIEVEPTQRGIDKEKEQEPPPVEIEPISIDPIVEPVLPVEEDVPIESIMEHFGVKDPFPTEPIDFELKPDEWLYIYGFSYAPDSTGKGIPAKKLGMKGIDRSNPIFMLDYGDVRFYLNKLNVDGYIMDKSGKPTLGPQKVSQSKFDHEKILNVLRSEDVLVPVPFWSVIQGRDRLVQTVEDRYVELLRALIDVHDIVEWDVDILASDDHLLHLPSIAEASKQRTPQRETRHQISRVTDVKLTEKVIFREKTFAQEIHNELLIHAAKTKVDYMIRLDNAIMGDWKSILSARYSVGKDKRRVFCQTIVQLQQKYDEYQLMFRLTNPTNRFSI
jgi:hypothetical protein